MSGTVHANNKLPNGVAAVGEVVITVNTEDQVIRDPAGDVVFQGPLTVSLVAGEATVTLPASDDDTLEPSGFTYTATEQLKHVAKAHYRSVDFQVTDGGTHHLADFASTEEVALDPSYGASLNGALGAIEDIRDLTDPVFVANQNASLITKEATLFGGQRPAPLRVPTLSVEDAWPNRDIDYRVLWSEDDGNTLYGYGRDGSFYKSTDAGQKWTRKGYFGIPVNRQSAFLKTPAGSFLTFTDGSAGPIYRSTDDCATWTVATGGTSGGCHPLGVQSWACDENTGYIYWGEYTTDAAKTAINLWRSTNDGATWTVFKAFPGPAGTGAKIRHIHGVDWDPFAERIMIFTGDSEDDAGIYRVNSGGTDVEAVVLNSDLPGLAGDPARAIGVMFFEDYVAWIPDTAAAYSYVQRYPRTDPTDVEVLTHYRMNQAGWFTCKASDDGSRWVACSGTDGIGSGIDNQIVHLYAIEDQGETIYEIGSLPAVATFGEPALGPVGSAGIHGDVFLMQAHNVATTTTLAMTSPAVDSGRHAAWRFRLGDGAGVIPWPERRRVAYGRSTRAGGPVTVVGAFSTVVFGHIRVPPNVTKLYVYDYGVDVQTGTRSAGRLQVRIRGGADIFTGTDRGRRAFEGAEAGEVPIATYTCTPSDDLEVGIFSASGDITATGYLDFAFGV